MCLPTRTTVEANRLESHWEIYLILYFGRGVTLSDVYCEGVTISDTHRAGGAPFLSFLHFFFYFPTLNSHPSLSSSLPPPSSPLSGSLNILWISKFLGSSMDNYPPRQHVQAHTKKGLLIWNQITHYIIIHSYNVVLNSAGFCPWDCMLYFCRTRCVRFAKQSLMLEFSVSAFLSHNHKKHEFANETLFRQGAKVLLHLRISKTP